MVMKRTYRLSGMDAAKFEESSLFNAFSELIGAMSDVAQAIKKPSFNEVGERLLLEAVEFLDNVVEIYADKSVNYKITQAAGTHSIMCRMRVKLDVLEHIGVVGSEEVAKANLALRKLETEIHNWRRELEKEADRQYELEQSLPF